MSEQLVNANRTFFVDETPRQGGRLTLAGTNKNSGGVLARPMRVFGQFALVLMVQGHGFYADARGTKCEVARGTAILVLPELPHVYGPSPAKMHGGQWDEIYLCFDGPLFELWRHEGLLDDSRLVHPIENWCEMFRRLHSLCEAPRPATAREHEKQLRELLAILAELFPPRETLNSEPEWLGKARSLLESNLDQALGGQEAARAAKMSYQSFRRAWTAQVGISPTRYRDQKRIEAAQVLLRGGTMTQS